MDQTLKPKWPVYLTGPDESMHALGVVSVNFANFERAMTWVLAAVAPMAEDDAGAILRKNPRTCAERIESATHARAWSGTVSDLVRHFVEATSTLIDNRNLLMHSVVTAGPNNMSNLYRTSRGGEMQTVEATTDQIRAVADDLHRYFSFARTLANCIAVKIDGADRKTGAFVSLDWPDKPRLPIPLLAWSSSPSSIH
jgi:hypothetical protein